MSEEYKAYKITPEKYGYDVAEFSEFRERIKNHHFEDSASNLFWHNITNDIIIFDVGKHDLWNGDADTKDYVPSCMEGCEMFFTNIQCIAPEIPFWPSTAQIIEVVLRLGYTLILYNHEKWFDIKEYERKYHADIAEYELDEIMPE